MFSNVEDKLKAYAEINAICGFILSGILFIAGIATENFLLFLPIAIAVPVTALLASWFVYAFAELLESAKRTEANVSNIVNVLKTAYAQEISEATTKRIEAEAEKEEQKWKEAASKRKPRANAHQDKSPEGPKEEVVKRLVRDKSPEELEALREETMVQLIELGVNADEKEKEPLLNLLSAIDEELNKR